MKLSLQLFSSSLFSALALVANAGNDAWHMDTAYTIVREALDPIVNPNGVASHMHRIVGGSNFGAAYNYATQNAASCTSTGITADKSSYWMPQLYFMDTSIANQTKYIPVATTNRFYYFLARSDPTLPVEPFPEGLRMLVGDPNSKSADPGSRFRFSCQTESTLANTIKGPNFNFDHTCPYGVKTEVFFPPCWDGVNLYKADGSHMSHPYRWPTFPDVHDGECPLSHPIRLPGILLEFTQHPAQVANGAKMKDHLVWANGDTTGFGIHADFIMGWDTDVLKRALNDPACVGVGNSMPMTSCKTFVPYANEPAAKACKPSLGVMQTPCTSNDNADFVGLKSLPGCNIPWSSGPKPTCGTTSLPDVTPFRGTDGPLIVPAAQRRGFSLPKTGGWQNIGCVKDDDAFPPFNSSVYFQDPAMTVAKCQEACTRGGYDVAGLQIRGGNMCKCAQISALNMRAARMETGCNSTCPGNTTEAACGGSWRLNLFYTPSGNLNSTAASSSYFKGCYYPTDSAATLKSATTYTFDSNTMTPATCREACLGKNAKWMGLHNGRTCMCGINPTFGPGTYVTDNQCDRVCLGNTTITCGGWGRYAMYNLTNTDATSSQDSKPTGWQGCFTKGDGQLALQGNSWKPQEPLTVESCVNGCSELKFKYAGLDSGDRCSCGNEFFSTKDLPPNQCTLPCPGNANQTCGGLDSNVELYNTSKATVTFASQQAAHPVGWNGCFADSNSIPALTSYYYVSNSMTVNMCKQACAGFNYPWAGVTNGNGCRCGTVAPVTKQMPAAWCSRACLGNTTETCGTSGYLEAFDLSTTVRTNYTSNLADGALGCFAEASNGNGLADYSFTNSLMTHSRCTSGCKELGYRLAGVENGVKCDCGNTWQGGQILPVSACNIACGGNSSQSCGGTSSLNVFNTTNVELSAQRAPGWLGCYADGGSSKTLTGFSYASNTMNTSICLQTCSNQGFTYAGTYNGNQCLCGDTITNPAGKQPVSQCNSPCPGDSAQFCGGGGRMDIYNSSAAPIVSSAVAGYVGCYNDLGKLNSFSFSSTKMSGKICKEHCKFRGYAYAGTDSGKTCRCGNTALTSLVAASACNMNCASTTTNETCGSFIAGSVYSTAQTSATALNDYDVGPSGSVGCFVQGSGLLSTTMKWNTNINTPTVCVAGCGQLGYDKAMMSDGGDCTCGKAMNFAGGGYTVADSECNRACPGDATKICGGGGRASLYDVKRSGIPAATTTVPGYTGCFQTGNFTLAPGYAAGGSDDTMSGTMCQRTCRLRGFAYAGVNNGDKCYCSNTPNYGSVVPYSRCYNVCRGDPNQRCGEGGNFISIYDALSPAGLPPTTNFSPGYVGCFIDLTNAKQLTGYKEFSTTKMSASICAGICSSRGFNIAGTESSNQCYCGNNLPTTLLLSDAKCNNGCTGMPSGATDEKCGGTDRISVYNLTVAGTPRTSSSSTTAALSSTRVSSSTIATGTLTRSSTVTGTLARSSTIMSSASTTSSRSSSSSLGSSTGSSSSRASASASGTASTTKAPLPSGNFVVVGGECDANDIGVSANSAAPSSTAAESSASSAAPRIRRKAAAPVAFRKISRSRELGSKKFHYRTSRDAT